MYVAQSAFAFQSESRRSLGRATVNAGPGTGLRIAQSICSDRPQPEAAGVGKDGSV